MNTRRWVCLDERNRIIAFGITQGRFDQRRMNFSCADFAAWILSGQKYTEVNAFYGLTYGQHISTFEHGPIRRSRAKVSFLGISSVQ